MSKAQFRQSKLALTGEQSSISSDEWYTPIDVVKRMHRLWHDPDLGLLDVASCGTANQHIKADKIFTKDDSALIDMACWNSDVMFMNPPYSRKLITAFVSRFIIELNLESFDQAIVLVNSCTDTQWFYRLATKADIRIDIQGRLKFWHPDKPAKSPISGSTIFYYGEMWEEFLDIFGDLGLCYERVAMR